MERFGGLVVLRPDGYLVWALTGQTQQRVGSVEWKDGAFQITGHSASEAYWAGGVGRKSGGVKLDGFEDGVLLDAKGSGFANKFNDDLRHP